MSIGKGGRQRLVLLAKLEDPGQMISQHVRKACEKLGQMGHHLESRQWRTKLSSPTMGCPRQWRRTQLVSEETASAHGEGPSMKEPSSMKLLSPTIQKSPLKKKLSPMARGTALANDEEAALANGKGSP